MSKKYEITGTLKHIGETQTFAKGFTKREFVIGTRDDKYPQLVKLEVTKERCAELDDCEIGDTMEVQFDIRGNEYNGKYYVNLQAWKFECTPNAPRQEKPQPQSRPAQQAAAQDDDGDDSIPF